MADLVLFHARIVTLDDNHPEVEAVAVRDGKIWMIGTTEEILALAGEQTTRIDLKGKLVLPGFADAHAHLMGLGERLATLDLTGTVSETEVVDRVVRQTAQIPGGEWILGRGWDQNDWEDRDFPDHRQLSSVTPRHPVFLKRIDGHAAWVNARALELAEISNNTKDPPGGKILRKDGRPSGILVDAAADLVERLIPPPSREEKIRRLEKASRVCLRNGLTSIHDAGISRAQVQLYREMADTGRLKLRVFAMLGGTGPQETPDLGEPPFQGYGNGLLAVRSVKLAIDGALGSRGAALLEPYADDPGNLGLILRPPEEITSIAVEAMRLGYQVCIHAIGDRGNRLALDALEKALQQVPEARNLRHRIEHAQVLSEKDLPRFAKMEVIASVQPTHCTSDMYWAGDRVGKSRTEGAYAWRSLLDSGARLACGSDFPIESEKPLWGIYASVTRQDHSEWPEGGWHPEERMSMEEAIRCFTADAAYAAFEENLRGTITPGKFADFTVLSKDITSIPPKEILDTEVEMTIVGGEIVYRREN